MRHLFMVLFLFFYHFNPIDICIVFTILWNRTTKCSTVWKISTGSETKSSAVGFGPNDIWRAKYNWTHGATDIDSHAKFDSMSTSSSEYWIEYIHIYICTYGMIVGRIVIYTINAIYASIAVNSIGMTLFFLYFFFSFSFNIHRHSFRLAI